MNSYDEYLCEWTREWALRISRRAGIEPGKGGRGKRDDPDRRLAKQLGADYSAWLRYKAGRQAPNSSTFKIIHENAVRLGLIGRGDTIEDEIDRLGPVDETRWLKGLSLEELVQLQEQALLLEKNPSLQEAAVANLARAVAAAVPTSISD
ncbi:MAG TPA: hypothetical protein VGK14_13615 [Novimethylophilus sp.]|jgi:hypothetical protein|uniref:hypothetical protein n=1 Tax=Novimethylophilus sp. TaxID=2137426 RepID=UPI002F423245